MSFPVPLPSTFMPLPLAIMIPFMGIQSGVMAQQFGMNFQYGKRKISAMSNEEFNKLTPAQMQADFNNQITGMIPTFQKALEDMRPFQRMIFTEMLAVMKTAIDLGIDVAKAGVDPLAHIFGEHIHPAGSGDAPTATGAPSPTNIPSPQPTFTAPFIPPTNQPSVQPSFTPPELPQLPPGISDSMNKHFRDVWHSNQTLNRKRLELKHETNLPLRNKLALEVQDLVDHINALNRVTAKNQWFREYTTWVTWFLKQ